jgi:hypothetical protein
MVAFLSFALEIMGVFGPLAKIHFPGSPVAAITTLVVVSVQIS